MTKRNILVIGAGISGLTAALKLLQAGHKVTIYSKEAAGVHPHTSFNAYAIWVPVRVDSDTRIEPWTDDSFDEFVVNRGPALLRFAYLLTGDRHRAEDLVQEVLAKVHQRWTRIERAEGAEFYVRTALVRQNISWWRRRSARSEQPVADVPDSTAPDDGELVGHRDERGLVEMRDEEQQEVLVPELAQEARHRAREKRIAMPAHDRECKPRDDEARVP